MKTPRKSSIFFNMSLLFVAAVVAHSQQTPQAGSHDRQSIQSGCADYEVISDFNTVVVGETVKFGIRSITSLGTDTVQWTTSKGSIISGQGTTEIEIRLADLQIRQLAEPRSKARISPDATTGIPHSVLVSPGPKPVLTVTATISGRSGFACPPVSRSVMVKRQPLKVNGAPDVTSLTLDESTLTLNVPPGYQISERSHPSEDMVIGVSTVAVGPENEVLTYNYTVSGGTVVGTGPNVKWDLSGSRPGTYTVTAGVDDGCGICGKTITKTVTVAQADYIDIVDCARIDISGPTLTSKTEIATFSAIVEGGDEPTDYVWSVKNGDIISGQRTHTVKVRMPVNDSESLSSISLTLKYRIGSDYSFGHCPAEVTKEYVKGRLKP